MPHLRAHIRRLLPLTLTLVLASLSGTTLGQDEEADRAEYRARMEELQQTIEKLKEQLEQTRGSRDELQEELEASESAIGDLLQKIERIESDLEEQREDLQSLRQRRDRLEQSRRQQQAAVAEQVRAAYQLGQQSQLKLLLNQQQPQRMSRLLRYHEDWLSLRAEKIQRYRETLAELDRIEPQIRRRATELARDRERLKKRREQLAQRQSQRRETLAALEQRIRSTDQKLAEHRRDRERLQTLLDEMTAAVAEMDIPGGDDFSERRGQLPWPAEGQVRHAFGSAQLGGQITRNGLVIDAREGAPVLAVHHGRVVFSDYFRGHGLLLIVDHGKGYMTLYAHNQTLHKETGEWVNAGETIARVGRSGGQSGAGLYFEIRHQGRPVDPGPWLGRA